MPGTAVICNDNNVCTTDTCDPATGCVFTNNTNTCDDNNACTTGDVCGNGTCAGTTITCNDKNACTTDTCDPATGCVFTNTTASCSDGNACTAGDTCSGGTCVPGAPVVCNDNNACTTDTCDPATGCVFTNNTNPCNDGNACTTGDACSGGTCVPGAPVVCNDNNVCTTDACNPFTGCVFTNNAAACSDGNACTTGDVCANGSCQPGTAVPAPGVTTGLAYATATDFTWDATPGATGYDVIRGTLSALRSAGFPTAVDSCLFDHVAATTASDAHLPAVEDGDWVLIRAVSPCGTGTYNDGSASLLSSRDGGIGASPNTCP